MKHLAIIVSSIFTIQALYSAALAETTSIAPAETSNINKVVSGNAALKNIGVLQTSEGLAIIKNNDIAILSDASDPISEAELSGRLINAHIIEDGQSPAIVGLAFFTKGYSIEALDGSKTNDYVKDTAGKTYLGHILNVTAGSLSLTTSRGVKVILTKEISEIKSPRAFEFSLVPETSSLVPAPSSRTAARNRISFSPTYKPEPIDATIALHGSKIYKQLSENQTRQRLKTTGIMAAAAAACVAIPLGVALTCPPEGH